MNPFDGKQFTRPVHSSTFFSSVIKQRMQVHKSEFHSVWTCAQTVYRKEGLAAFYVSYPTTLAISIPFNAIQYTVYEHMKRILNPRHEYSPSTHIISGAVAGAVAAGLTTPLDVAKTILQTRGASHDPEIRKVAGMGDAFRVIWKHDGLKGFARGLTPRVLTTMPSTALCWLSYEFFSTLFYPIFPF
jgi:solute carrier family 25 (mitochondrial iron transporter), member 28/37